MASRIFSFYHLNYGMSIRACGKQREGSAVASMEKIQINKTAEERSPCILTLVHFKNEMGFAV
ncbi:hypothetical protein [Niallia endozanthoxylica]|uniref:Uncharacterized protein n=1 Tax=Niallia endozanthoxylica TaxID=2036016 RepID=A0A5J5HQY3_9BACI|nr:hypothetical protein [Niallia endozanthoxylica]KAA9022866.1 hypothetical protein F4V44_14055 [Niallia endozanthoxylica]